MLGAHLVDTVDDRSGHVGSIDADAVEQGLQPAKVALAVAVQERQHLTRRKKD